MGATARLPALPISLRLATPFMFGSQAEREYVPWLGPNNVECQWFGTEYVAPKSLRYSAGGRPSTQDVYPGRHANLLMQVHL